MALSDEQRAFVVDEVVRILRSPKRAELLDELRRRLEERGEAIDATREELEQVVLAVADTVSELLDGEGDGEHP